MTTLNPMRTPNTVPDAERLIEQLQAYVDMEADQKRQIGDRVRELRENSRYTNETLAQAVGVSARAVGKWIEGERERKTPPSYRRRRWRLRLA